MKANIPPPSFDLEAEETTKTEKLPEPSKGMNSGQRALAEMRRQRAEAKNAELQKLQALVETDAQVRETPAAIPEKVAQRMGSRMIAFVGLPLFLGLGSFVAFWYFATYKGMEFQPGLVAATTIGLLAISLLVRLAAGKQCLVSHENTHPLVRLILLNCLMYWHLFLFPILHGRLSPIVCLHDLLGLCSCCCAFVVCISVLCINRVLRIPS